MNHLPLVKEIHRVKVAIARHIQGVDVGDRTLSGSIYTLSGSIFLFDVQWVYFFLWNLSREYIVLEKN